MTARCWPKSCELREWPSKYRDYEGVAHQFFGMGAVVAKAKAAEGTVVADLKIAFKTDALPTSQ
jgi:hypothetical protein